jgi:L-alanine-DL-glutamate epimerase-like enolase superfamily enzyme
MRIIDLREQTFGIESSIRNGVIDFSEMTVSVVALVSDQERDGRRVVGFGFNSNGRYGQGGLLRERFFPRIRAADPDALLDENGRISPDAIAAVARRNEKPGGHGERTVAVGVIDMAAWDLVAKLEGEPLHRVIAGRHGVEAAAEPKVCVYGAGGYYYPGRDLGALTAEILGYVGLGYRVVKMKIGGAPLAEDIRRIEAVLAALPAGCRLAVDANGAYRVEEAVACARALSGYDLAWFEEPVDPCDYAGLAAVAQMYPGPLATGENLFSVQDATNLLRHGGLRADRDILQFDPVLSYGLGEFAGMLEAGAALGWGRERFVPHGGHQFNLHIAAGLGIGGCEGYPGTFQPFGGFADGEAVRDGYVTVPSAPGLGLELKARLAERLDQVMGS